MTIADLIEKLVGRHIMALRFPKGEPHKVPHNQMLLHILIKHPEERTCEANAAGENSSFIFTVCVHFIILGLPV